ncbi:MAG: ATP synthase F1 subunit delta [Pirellulaceae bacterium]
MNTAAENGKQRTVFDTDKQYLGDVYAKALLGLAQKSDNVEQVIDEVESFAVVLDALPALRATLESPRVSFAEKEKIIDKAIGGKGSKAFVNFIKVLCRNGRADCLSAVRESARHMHDEAIGRVRATMTTAVAVDQHVQDKVARRLSQVLGKTVAVRSTVDPDIIGGLVVRIGDTVYDDSVTNQLKRIRVAAIGRANQEIRQALERFVTDV